MPLDAQTRLNITRWTQEYIAGLIENLGATLTTEA